MGNRRQPFGYRMQFGEIVVDLPEAELVKMIFQEYLLGASFQSLADILQAQDISYEEGKRWNKNMVARILGDKRYQGQNGYPKLIDVEVIEAAAAKRATKAPPVQKTEEQKVLRRICGFSVTQTLENQVRQLLNGLIANPQILRAPEQPPVNQENAMHIQQKLDKALSQQPIDENYAKALIMDLAAAQYGQLDSLDYETERIRRLLLNVKPMAELDAALLREIVTSVYSANGAVKLQLKNDQMIERSILA